MRLCVRGSFRAIMGTMGSTQIRVPHPAFLPRPPVHEERPRLELPLPPPFWRPREEEGREEETVVVIPLVEPEESESDGGAYVF